MSAKSGARTLGKIEPTDRQAGERGDGRAVSQGDAGEPAANGVGGLGLEGVRLGHGGEWMDGGRRRERWGGGGD